MKETIGQFTLYGLNELKDEFLTYASYTPSSEELKSTVHKLATIIPYKEHIENGQLLYPKDGAVFDSDWELVEDSAVKWGDVGVANVEIALGNFHEIPSTTIHIDEDVVYLGHIYAHFGHFLVDSLQRLYIYLNENVKPLKAAYISNGEDKFIELFKLFGICPSKTLRIETPTTFRSVLVCAPSACYHYYINKDFRRTCNQIRQSVTGKNVERVYLSRSKITTFGKVYGEELFENIFKKNGFEIVYPETLPLEEQISYVKNCKILAGTSGSAMHLSLFTNDETKCIHFQRSNHLLPMQILFDRITSAKSVYVEAFEELLPVNICYSPYFININKFVEAVLVDNDIAYCSNTKYNKKDIISFIWCYALARRKLRGNYKFKTDITISGVIKLLRMLFQ